MGHQLEDATTMDLTNSQRGLSRRFAGATFAAAAFGVLTASGAAAQSNNVEVAGLQTGMLLARDPAPTPAVMQLEMDFLTGMIPHHHQSVEMARMALSKAHHADLRTFAQFLEPVQRQHIEKMTQFLRDWYGHQPNEQYGRSSDVMDRIAVPLLHGDTPDFASRVLHLKMLDGPAFDVEFMQTLSIHHAAGIAMAAPVLMAAHHEDLHHLAQELVISQGQDIRQLDRWLKEWYDVSRAS